MNDKIIIRGARENILIFRSRETSWLFLLVCPVPVSPVLHLIRFTQKDKDAM